LAENRLGVWGGSNWIGKRTERRKKFLLMSSLKEELPYFEELLAKERPNLLLIGAMTLCFPGAIECARLAKQMFGDKICVVLGGRHVNETVYMEKMGKTVLHHRGSPLALMKNGEIDPIFDIVISGESEMLIAKIGELIMQIPQDQLTPKNIFKRASETEFCYTPGKWIIGCLVDDNISTIVGCGPEIDNDRLPSPAKMFGVRSEFNVFKGRLTGQVFSDTGRGCVYSCDFCSENSSVAGPLKQLETSANRLFRQLLDVKEVIDEDSPGSKASAFIEDSIILGGVGSQLNKLISLLQTCPVDIKFGCQLTVDLALRHKDLLEELKGVGLEYIFFGLETLDPDSVGGMSKDTKKTSWISRFESVVELLVELEISIGVSILFGLGEAQHERLKLLKKIREWKDQHGEPSAISFNWAVQHPLYSNDGGSDYKYLKWGISSLEYLRAFRDYGEASLEYPLNRNPPPSLEDLAQIQKAKRSMGLIF